MSETDILFEVRGVLGLVTLNRPQALNALTHEMVLRLERQLDGWRDDDAVQVVAIQGAGERAFCAGGDIRALYDAGRPGGERGANNFQFYVDEYRLNTKIKRYPKPYVSIMDGIVMGGGVGVSIHGSHRIATERTVFAMPETGIGLFPDVGGTWFLPRIFDGSNLGMYIGLTGARMRGPDAAYVLDAVALPSNQVDALIELLTHPGADNFLIEPGPLQLPDEDSWGFPSEWWGDLHNPLNGRITDIERAFGGESVDEILRLLEDQETEWATKQREIILSKSPTCTRLAFRQIREGAKLEFEDCMRLEYRLARFCMTHGDFYEGVRATIIDKDGAPKWSPATLAEVSDAMIDEAFTELGTEELQL